MSVLFPFLILHIAYSCQDDGSHSIACERCNVWQHSSCLGVSQADAEKEDFHFICVDCKRKEEDAKKPKIPSLKFKLSPTSMKTKVFGKESYASNGVDEAHSTHSTIRVEVPKRVIDAVATMNGTSDTDTNSDTIKLTNGNSTHSTEPSTDIETQPQKNGTNTNYFASAPEHGAKHSFDTPMTNGTTGTTQQQDTRKPETNGVYKEEKIEVEPHDVDVDMINGQDHIKPTNGITDGKQALAT